MGAKHLRVDGDRAYARTRQGFEILVTGMAEGEMLARGVIFDDGEAAEVPEGPSARIVDEDRDDQVFTTAAGGGDSEEDADDQGDVEYPVHKGGGNWELSDGSSFRGKKETAAEAEAALHDDAGDGDAEGDAGDDEES